MTIKHYELAAEDNSLTFSPYCWRTRMALLHKGVDFTTVPWFFSDKTATQASGSDKAPVLNDDGHWVADSWEIAKYLDEKYPDAPALIINKESLALAKLVDSICTTQLFPAVVPVVLTQVHKALRPQCQAYFRETREAFFNTELENINIDADTGKANIANALTSFDALLDQQEFISGAAPAYADYVLYGLLKWVDVISEYNALDTQSVTGKWFERMEQLFDAHGKNATKVRA